MAVDLSQLPPAVLAQLPPEARAGIVDIKQAPDGGWYALGNDGGVFALGGAQFHGSVPGLRDPQGRPVNVLGGAARLELGPDGGYTVVGGEGHRYAFGTPYVSPQQKAQEAAIYKDPAYLAFVRGADLSLEEAARQASRRQAALESAFALQVPELQMAEQQAVKKIGDTHEARGLFRSGARLSQQQEEQRQRQADLAKRRAGVAEEIAKEHETLAGRVADVQRQAGEKGFSVAQQQDLQKRTEELRKKYPAQFGART